MSRRWVLVAALSAALVAAACGGEVVDDGITIEVLDGPLPTSTATALTLRPTATATVTATATAEAVDERQSLDEFIDEHGYPADPEFARLRIPVLGVDSPAFARYVEPGADEMPLPAGPADIAWFDLSAWSGLGGAPGEGRNAIFAGHVDYAGMVPYTGERYRGVGVFNQIGRLQAGDIIEIEYAGAVLRYAVTWNRQVAADDQVEWDAIWSDAVSADSITLYTCGGTFDSASASYADRVVVRAERIG